MIDINKKYRTRDGREVRIYAIHDAGKWCVHGAIKSITDELWWPHQWTISGEFVSPANCVDCSAADLLEVLPEVTVTKSIIKERFGTGLSMTIPDVNLPNWPNLGLINITHDGQKLIRVEIVK